MTRKELPEASPESLGISSHDIIDFIHDLESSGTEMHGFMILRHGKVAAKGWWTPYAPGLIHGSQSLTKTITGVAYGIAEHEGILSLEDRLIDNQMSAYDYKTIILTVGDMSREWTIDSGVLYLDSEAVVEGLASESKFISRDNCLTVVLKPEPTNKGRFALNISKPIVAQYSLKYKN
jgi:hypothetical protein